MNWLRNLFFGELSRELPVAEMRRRLKALNKKKRKSRKNREVEELQTLYRK